MPSIAEEKARGVVKALGRKYTRDLAEELLSMEWRNIVGAAKKALRELEPNPGRREAAWETSGVQFRLHGYEVWMAKRGHKIVCRIKDR